MKGKKATKYTLLLELIRRGMKTIIPTGNVNPLSASLSLSELTSSGYIIG